MADEEAQSKLLSGGSGGEPPPQRAASPVPPQPRRRTSGGGGSTQTPRYGRADVRVYPINEDQLAQLGTLRGLAGVCFTLAGAAFGFALNVYKDLQIQGQVPPDVLAYWSAIRDVSFVAS